MKRENFIKKIEEAAKTYIADIILKNSRKILFDNSKNEHDNLIKLFEYNVNDFIEGAKWLDNSRWHKVDYSDYKTTDRKVLATNGEDTMIGYITDYDVLEVNDAYGIKLFGITKFAFLDDIIIDD